MPGILSAESLPNIQGNILTPFKKERFLYVFACFGDDAQRSRDWLAEIVADPALASTQKMLDEVTRPIWLAIGFTFSGLVALHSELADELTAFTSFRQGAAADRDYGDGSPAKSAALVGDPAASDPSRWVVGAPHQEPDVVLTIAADDDDLLMAAAQKEWDRAATHGLVVLDLKQGDGTTTPDSAPAGSRARSTTSGFGTASRSRASAVSPRR